MEKIMSKTNDTSNVRQDLQDHELDLVSGGASDEYEVLGQAVAAYTFVYGVLTTVMNQFGASLNDQVRNKT
jgi:hypothetical protein